MGTLRLPPTGKIYVDANTIIYAVEHVKPYASLLVPLWQAAQRNQITLVTSELTWLETLTKPIHDTNDPLETLFRAFLTAEEMTLIPATLFTWEHAARLRNHGLKTPDALHAATSLIEQCVLFVTNDAIFQRVPNLPVTVLRSVLASQ